MGLFFKKKSSQPNAALLSRVNGQSLRYVTRRTGSDPTETVVGKGGSLSIHDSHVIVACDEGVVAKIPLEQVQIGELLSGDGATVDFEENGIRVTLVAYYTYYRKVN